MQSGEDFSRLSSIIVLALAIGSFFLFNSLFLAVILVIAAIGLFLGFLPTYGHVREGENVVIFRFGKYLETRQPGLFWYFPRFDEPVLVDMRTQVIDVPPADYITKDNIIPKIDCIYYIKIVNARDVLTKVKDYKLALTSLISSKLRDIVADLSFDDLNAKIEDTNTKLRELVDAVSKDWGLQVEKVEVTQIIPPASLVEILKQKKEAEQRKLTLEIQARTKSVNLEVLNDVASKLDDKTLTFLYLEAMKSMAEGRSNKIYFPSELTTFVNRLSGLVKSNTENK